MRYTLDQQQCRNLEVASRKEWLLPNGIGGYAMGTVSGINTRRYHGHLIAAENPPTGRYLLIASVECLIQAGGSPVGLSANQYPGAIYPEGYHYIQEFSVGDSAIWDYRAQGLDLQKELYVHPGENAVTLTYRNTGKSALQLLLRPLVTHRDHHGNFGEWSGYPHKVAYPKDGTVITHEKSELHLTHHGAQRMPAQGWYYRFEHAIELERGLDPRDDLYCACELKYELLPGESAVIVAATKSGVAPQTAPTESSPDKSISALLKRSAAKFIVETDHRASILAGYPWFTDWGRDTMISIPGICLETGRVGLARQILRDYKTQLHNGLIPNRFVEAGETPDYNTVDATLWFVNAIYKTLQKEWNQEFAEEIMPTLAEIFACHQAGTEFGIKVDPRDGLLTQGGHGLQLTWMDAKVGDWVITPRHGKPVEINGLWINALRVMEWLAEKLDWSAVGLSAKSFAKAATLAESSFERSFWHEGRGHYVDTFDPIDASLRPNQVIAMALPLVKLNPDHAARALSVVSRELLTPNGLRTLGPEEPGYRGRYTGSMPERDAAYHQGTVWPWLLGSYVTAVVRYGAGKAEGKRVLRHTKAMLIECGLGGISEVYDGDEPQHPSGCPWQAWSVAEILRAWVEDVGGD